MHCVGGKKKKSVAKMKKQRGRYARNKVTKWSSKEQATRNPRNEKQLG